MKELAPKKFWNIPNKRDIIRTSLWTIIVRAELKRKHVVYGKTLMANGMPSIDNKGKIVIGNHTFIDSGARMDRVSLWTENANAVITIGDGCNIRGCEICAREKVTIGDACFIAPRVYIWDNDGHSTSIDRKKRHTLNSEIKPIYIGSNVWVCASSYILKGVTIGDNSIIGAGSIVTKDVEPNCLYGGNPAKFIKKLTD
jgi:acetyltransferase-like isoleucine patch superfamily enzyme